MSAGTLPGPAAGGAYSAPPDLLGGSWGEKSGKGIWKNRTGTEGEGGAGLKEGRGGEEREKGGISRTNENPGYAPAARSDWQSEASYSLPVRSFVRPLQNLRTRCFEK